MRDNMRGLLERVLKESGLAAPIKRQLPKQIWDSVMGKEIAARAQPTVLAAGVLHVLVQDHRWRDQLDAMRTELKARLNARLGKELVRELRFGLAHAGALPARTGARAGDRTGSYESDAGEAAPPWRGVEGAALEQVLPAHLKAAALLGPELREAFLRAGHAAGRARAELPS